jgi:hypothetical protein
MDLERQRMILARSDEGEWLRSRGRPAVASEAVCSPQITLEVFKKTASSLTNIHSDSKSALSILMALQDCLRLLRGLR